MPLAAAVGRRPDREGVPAADREGRARLLWLGVVSMRGRVPSYREIGVPPGPGVRLSQAPALGRLLPVGAATRDVGSWLAPLLLIAIAGVGGAILAGGLPVGPAGPVTVGLLAIAAALTAAGLSGRVGGRRVAVPALVGVGMCGAGLDLLADGTGYVIGYMAVAGLALRTPPRVALLAGSPVVAAIAGVVVIATAASIAISALGSGAKAIITIALSLLFGVALVILRALMKYVDSTFVKVVCFASAAVIMTVFLVFTVLLVPAAVICWPQPYAQLLSLPNCLAQIEKATIDKK